MGRSGFPPLLIVAIVGVLALAAVIIVLLLGPLRPDQSAETADGPVQVDFGRQADAAFAMADCQPVIEFALDAVEQGCQASGLGQACYGHQLVAADLSPQVTGNFAQVGNTVSTDVLRALSTYPLDVSAREWGIAVVKVPTTLGGSDPVTFLVFGNTALENVSGDMKVIRFSTGQGAVTCSAVPVDGLLVQTPEKRVFIFEANGATLVLTGTAFLEAEPGGEMTVTMLDGSGTVSVGDSEQPVEDGNEVKIPLDDLDASGPPSGPEGILPGTDYVDCLFFGGDCPSLLEVAEAGDVVAAIPPTATPTPTASDTPTITPTPTATPTASNTPTATSTPTATPTATFTSSPVPTATLVPTSTLGPVELVGNLYLHNDPSPPDDDTDSHDTLPMDDDEPTEDDLYNYDENRDNKDGLRIRRGGDDFDEDSSSRHQRWRSDTFDRETRINGEPRLIFWSAMKNFDDNEQGRVRAYLAATNGSDEAWIIQGTENHSNWQDGSSTWVRYTLEFDDEPDDIPAGYRLELVIVVRNASDDDMWFAYDTEDYETRLDFPD